MNQIYKDKLCKVCGKVGPHKKINQGYNRCFGPARVWAVLCKECAEKPSHWSEIYMTQEEAIRCGFKMNAEGYETPVL